MPSSMIHSIAAYKYDPSASPLFYIGNLAPDSIVLREVKDRLHFRKSSNREMEIGKMLYNVDEQDNFMRGVVYHLYLDMLWDREIINKFINDYKGANWFLSYREAIGEASAWLYHSHNWSLLFWKSMCNYEISKKMISNDYTVDGIQEFIYRNEKWHRENRRDSIGYFSEEVINNITDYTANTFDLWCKQVNSGIK